ASPFLARTSAGPRSPLPCRSLQGVGAYARCRMVSIDRGRRRNSNLTWVVYTAMLAHRRMLGINEMLRLGSQPLDTPAELSPVDTDGAPGGPPTVLVVDDDRAVRDVLCAVLKEEGYPVRQASSADAALQRSEEHTSELQSRGHLVCRLLLEKKKRCRHPHRAPILGSSRSAA